MLRVRPKGAGVAGAFPERAVIPPTTGDEWGAPQANGPPHTRASAPPRSAGSLVDASVQANEGDERIRTAVRGFAGLCLTTRPRRPGRRIVAPVPYEQARAWAAALLRGASASDTIRPGAWGARPAVTTGGRDMNRTRGRLVVACLALIGAAIAVAGGGAGNRVGDTDVGGRSGPRGGDVRTEHRVHGDVRERRQLDLHARHVHDGAAGDPGDRRDRHVGQGILRRLRLGAAC